MSLFDQPDTSTTMERLAAQAKTRAPIVTVHRDDLVQLLAEHAKALDALTAITIRCARAER